MNSWTSIPTQRSPHPQAPCASSSNCFAPYDKPDKTVSQMPYHSFHDPKSTLCLKCGMLGHHTNPCHSSSNHPNHLTIINWKDGHLFNKAGVPICIIFNVKGSCHNLSSGYPTHSCSLCGDSALEATSCTHN